MEYIPIVINVLMAAVMAFGMVLTLIGLPGNLLILLAALACGWQEGFSHLTYASLSVVAALWLGGEILEFIAGIRGAKQEKASWWATVAAVVGSIAGGIIGTGILPLVGTVIGVLAGGFACSYYVEYLHTKDKQKARQVAKGAVKGQLAGMLIKFSVAIVMSAIILYKLLFAK